MSKEVFVKCRLYRGMFSDESVVEFPRVSGENTFIVPKAKVSEESPGHGRLKAKLLTRGDERWVILPTDYSDSVPASQVDLVEA